MEIPEIRRCRHCVLPETVPFVEFDATGICRHCRAKAFSTEGSPQEELVRRCGRLTKNADGNDCIVALSGGRDSSYVLHYAVRVLGLNPLVFIYDWGMLTETGRENQIKMLKTLRLKEVFLEDNPSLKQRNIRRNLDAWLSASAPAPGLIPLFMAGDKPFFYFARKLKRERRLEMLLSGLTDIEAEDFKEGFCGVRTESFVSGKNHYGLHPAQKLKVIGYYGAQFLRNPRYLNASILDTLFGFYSYYLLPHDYFTNLFQYVPWDEETMLRTLKAEYDWRPEPDAASSWRTGDASAPFIHYLFLSLYGFTENDFLRSNQIRRGMISRPAALARLGEENKPRLDGVKSFCRRIDLNSDYLTERVGIFADALRSGRCSMASQRPMADHG